MCGLSAIISKEPTNFDINHFNILGTLNDERGGDSCGIWIDGIVDYGVKDKSYFRDFTYHYQYPDKASIAMLHCRKTSAGNITNLQQAQPVVIDTKRGKFVLMHNGTIYNADSLAHKYDPQFKTIGLSDSQIMAHLICNFGFDVLEEYTGTAVFIIADYRHKTPKVYIFKGDSYYNEQNSKSERPLMYMVHDNKFYCASMFSALYCITTKSTIYEVPTNKVLTVGKDNKLYIVQEIDRSKVKPAANNTVYTGVYKYYVDDDYTDRIQYNAKTGLYYADESNLAHGEYDLYPSGYTINKYYVKNSQYIKVYFFNGRLLFNKECFDLLNSCCDLVDENIVVNNCPEIIDYFSVNPTFKNGRYFKVTEDFKYEDVPFNFSFCPPYGGYIYNLINGRVASKVSIFQNTAYEKFAEISAKTKIDQDAVEEKMYRILCNYITDDGI